VKLALTQRLLAVRAAHADLFARGSHHPLAVTGTHSDEIIAYARVSGRAAVVVVTARLFKRATHAGWPSREEWDASISLEDFEEMMPVLSPGDRTSNSLPVVSELFSELPVAILLARYAPTRKASKRQAHVSLVPPI
jgi:(1->4)-alpha-D-glucan 1-alpha-D-glucosylmutase